MQNYVIGCVLKLYTTNVLSAISFVLHIDIFEYFSMFETAVNTHFVIL